MDHVLVYESSYRVSCSRSRAFETLRCIHKAGCLTWLGKGIPVAARNLDIEIRIIFIQNAGSDPSDCAGKLHRRKGIASIMLFPLIASSEMYKQ